MGIMEYIDSEEQIEHCVVAISLRAFQENPKMYIRITSRGNLLINFLRISFLGFCGDGGQVRLMSFFVSFLLVPAAENAIVVAWNFLVRPEISRFFLIHENKI